MSEEIIFAAYTTDPDPDASYREHIHSFRLNHVPPIGSYISFPGIREPYRIAGYEYEIDWGGGLRSNNTVYMIVEK